MGWSPASLEVAAAAGVAGAGDVGSRVVAVEPAAAGG